MKVVTPKQVWGMPMVPFTAEIAIDQRKLRNVSLPMGKASRSWQRVHVSLFDDG